ncbi:MAG TPA: cytochrome c [Alphaproteobacteria bacterium]|nr:cytochrome c [Alphaproteobacteria bacterium]
MNARMRVGPTAILLFTSLWSSTSAQERVEQGRDLARTWCSGCHLVEEEGGQSGSDAAPPFSVIAHDPSLTPDQLRSWLVDPHPPMPNLSLTRDEIEDLVAYIGSLRAE